MPFILTPDTFEHLWEESEQNGQASCPDTDTDTIDQAVFPHIGRFWQCYTPLQPGLALGIQEWEVPIDLLHIGGEGEPKSDASLVFYLSGKVQTTLHGLTTEMVETVGHYNFCACSGFRETELWQAGEPFHRIYLDFEPLTLFGHLTGVQLDQTPLESQRTLEGKHRPYNCYRPMTPGMRQVLKQILQCSYDGLLKRMYLQGKAWELMALAFEQLRPTALEPAGVQMQPALLHNDSAFRLKALLYKVWSIRAFN